MIEVALFAEGAIQLRGHFAGLGSLNGVRKSLKYKEYKNKKNRVYVVELLIGMSFLFFFSQTALGADKNASPGVFGFSEQKYEGLKPFPKWRGVVERYLEQLKKVGDDCDRKQKALCLDAAWRALVDLVEDRDAMEQLHLVNEFMNSHIYTFDMENWGVEDYWATPFQFFGKMGDCEDYSIAKYLTLRMLGWPIEKLKIIVLQDMNLNVTHANLAVSFEGKTLILDNQLPEVVEAKRISHYLPVYAVNEENWWRFKRAR